MSLDSEVRLFEQFCGGNLTTSLRNIETSLKGLSAGDLKHSLTLVRASRDTLAAAGRLKRALGQLNVVVHALGILLCLPHLLEADETIESLSLGAGNTGRSFDLETNRRVAEFKFIAWRGGAEAIRQNSLFKDFFLLAEHQTHKRKELYVLGMHHPLKFLNGGRAINSVLSKNVAIYRAFAEKYGERYATVREYFLPRQGDVKIVDVSPWLEGLVMVDNVEAND